MAVRTALISIVVPCFNEAANIQPFFKALKKNLPISDYSFEILFIDDGSQDSTVDEIKKLTHKSLLIRTVELARNFGKEVAVTAGLHEARGDAAIIIDADLQHPPQLIKEFLYKWEEGAEVVVGVRSQSRSYASSLKRLGSHAFYKILDAISDVKVIPGSTDYRLLDRSVIIEFNRFTEHNRMTRGLIDWLGFRRDYVQFVPDQRANGEASYSIRKLTGLALNSFVSMSLFPLKLAGYIGITVTFVVGAVGLFVIFEQIVMSDPMGLNVSGTGELSLLLVFLVGIMLSSLGLIALYVASIHTEVVNRPLYVVRHESGRNSSRELAKQLAARHV